MARYERIVNNILTNLDGAINDSVTSVVVTDASSYPTEGDFRILVGSEVMLVTARSGNTLTVVRGVDGTSAASHSTAAEVNVILTQSGLDAWLDNLTGNSSARPAARLYNASGTVLTKASFTGDNVTDSWLENNADGSITVLGDNSTTTGNAQHVWYKSAPTAPWTLTACLTWGIGWNHVGFLGGGGATEGGILCRENSTNEFIAVTIHASDRFDVRRFTSASAVNSQVPSAFEPHVSSPIVWMQIEDNNTNLFWRVSHDGLNWFELASESRTAFMAGGPDDIGFCLSVKGPGSAEGSVKEMTIRSWLEE